MPELRTIPLSQIIEPPAPMRATMNEEKLYELRDSIRSLGLLQPIIVVERRPSCLSCSGAGLANCPHILPDSHIAYEIVAGHRRFIACRMVPMDAMLCMVFVNGTIAKEAAMIAENVFREDVTAAEEGWFYCELVDKYTLTEAQLCDMVKQKPEYIYARMDMVKADADLAKMVAERKLVFGVAQQLLRCKDKAHRDYLATMAVDSGASIKQVKMWVAQWQQQEQAASAPAPAPAQAETTATPVDTAMRCLLCGGSSDPQNLRLVYLHFYELDGLTRILREAGLNPGETAA